VAADGSGASQWHRLRSTYDIVASAYEERFADELRAKPRDRELLESFAARTSDPIVELGCGPGQIGAFLRASERRVLGIDLSVEMTRLAKQRLDCAVAADMRSLPLRTASVGGVVAFYSLIHLPRRELSTVFAEMTRVLRSDGVILVAVHEGKGEVQRDEFLGQPVPFVASLYRLEELAEAAESAGLRVTLAERRGPYAGESGTTRLYLEGIDARSWCQ
jgi:SAM-dependent methyltransferase